ALTMLFGWNQFRSERWWDKKAEAYIAIIDKFHALLDEDLEYWDADEKHADIPDTVKDELRAKAKAAENEILRLMRLSEFLICEEASRTLRIMFQKMEAAQNTPDWVEFRTNESRALWDGFNSFKKIAAKDLGVVWLIPRIWDTLKSKLGH
ncbi:MAG: hypothetical protein ABSA49_08490, partial [Rhizomicrobium sp.]